MKDKSKLPPFEREVLAIVVDGGDPYDAFSRSYQRFVVGAVRRLIRKGLVEVVTTGEGMAIRPTALVRGEAATGAEGEGSRG